MEIRLSSKLQIGSISDGDGIRAVLWTQGCPHKCPGCHNPKTHDYNGGFVLDASELIKELSKHSYLDGITFSGGEPFEQPEALIEVAKAAHKVGLNVWSYTGYTYEQITSDKRKMALLEHIDVLVDGPFILSLKTLNKKFRGSSNQRIIDVKQSLKENRAIVID